MPQQAPRPIDQIIEVGDAGGAFGAGVGGGEGLCGTQPGGDVAGESRTVLKPKKPGDQIGKAACLLLVIRLGLRLARRNARSALFGEDDFAEIAKARRAFDRGERQPLVDDVGVAKAGRRAPSPHKLS